jgi:hypothetical protein
MPIGVRVEAAAIRGGNFNNDTNAGVFSLNLYNGPSNANYNIGWRACKRLRPESDGGFFRLRFSVQAFGTLLPTPSFCGGG